MVQDIGVGIRYIFMAYVIWGSAPDPSDFGFVFFRVSLDAGSGRMIGVVQEAGKYAFMSAGHR